MDRSSASSVRLSGASAAVSRTGSGSHCPMYSSRRARAEVSMSRQSRVVVVMRNALGFRHVVAVGRMPAQVRRPEPRPRRQPSTQACDRRDREGADGTARSSRRDSTSFSRRSGGVAGAGESQPTEGHADQPHHHGDDTAGEPVAGAETAIGSEYDQPTDDQADRSQHQGYDGPASSAANADMTGGASQASPPMTAPMSPVTAAPLAMIRLGVTV